MPDWDNYCELPSIYEKKRHQINERDQCVYKIIYPLRLAHPCSTEYRDKMAYELKSNCICTDCRSQCIPKCLRINPGVYRFKINLTTKYEYTQCCMKYIIL